MSKHKTVGLDLAKSVFHLIGSDGERRKLKRSQVLRYFAQQEKSVVVMEACGSAHYWGREFKALGHDVQLLPPQHVKAYLRGQKNDYNDAQAILEAALHGRIRTVEVKTEEQQVQQAVLIMRKGLVRERTRLVNQTRALLYEYGVSIPKSLSRFRTQLVEQLEETNTSLPSRIREMAQRQYPRLVKLDEEIAWCEAQIQQASKQDEDCLRLRQAPGFGPIVSYAFKSWLGTGRQFTCGRDASAALGVIPKQHTSGDKDRLMGITKRGDAYLRSLIIHGARSVVRQANKKDDPLSQWINRLVAKRGVNKATVALANKLIRIGWAMVARQESYRPIAC
ncbi:IS110 family transposase [Hahella sp. CR1]|uniref:IS110 family transposase n=1 Tax=Hahella sp. CR1 TaxID=2992807 RepID=UPI00244142C1|nr:IS110 family transposase [Hahella sp. CR1]MDG9672362.1 IS110 family transposase [Hahella sp. CR1]